MKVKLFVSKVDSVLESGKLADRAIALRQKR